MWIAIAFFALSGALFSNVKSVSVPRIELRRDGDVRWHFVRGSERLPFNIGWNHFHYLTDPCADGDRECKSVNLFEKLYQSNASAAALGALSQFHDLAFTGGGYDSVPPEHMAEFPFLQSMFLFDANEWRPEPQFEDPWDARTLAQVDEKIHHACDKVKPYRDNVLGYIFNDALAYNINRSQQMRGSGFRHCVA